ncbi:FAD-dependent oxidoreductase [Stieleria sp. ICT_E10.1]|uniref:FAD-dependent oxidoreductase n=1 Tax=Stieleria sedimenti TaxID=2976331 RepID=UPI00217FA1D9|nr:FAD-dependent oxidoreductase [Stieleria sedimenti]MCS7467852.1 FAD-dependent oxidoreductase [Stieleria sedimenti]
MRFVLALLIGLFVSIPNAKTANEMDADVLIVGGTESGWAAAIQAARLGIKKIVIVHDGRWLGGQFTEQALACVDENKGVGKVGWGVDWHPMKRSFHRFGLFKELMDGIEAFNTAKYGSPMPGLPHHGPSTFRPAEAEAIFREMLRPYLQTGQVVLVTDRYPVKADVDRSAEIPKLTGLWFSLVDGSEADLHVRAKITIDASDWGDAIQVSGAAFEYGPDPPSRYGEPSAPENAPTNEMNPITWAMIVAESDQETPIAKPPRFDDRNYPRATHFSLNEFRDLDWDVKKVGLGAIRHWPDAGETSKRQLTVYSVRRIVEGRTSRDGKTAILLNYMNGQDYPLERLPAHVADALDATEPDASQKNIVILSRAQREIIFRDAKQHALGVLYHLQNFVHDRAPDQTNSFRRFHLSDEFGTPDRLPPKPYIRESLRLKAMYMMREQDGRNRDGETKTKATPRFAAVMYPDGLFAWQFHYDFHRTGRTYLISENAGGKGNQGPWIDYHKPLRHTNFLSDRSVFPLRSLVPERFDGLLGAQGNLGFSSIVSAAIRLHDQRIHIGQAAGATAAVALDAGVSPRQIPYDRALLESVRHGLCGQVDTATPILLWPFRDLDSAHPAFVAINRLAALGLLPLGIRDVDFRPDDPASADWIAEVVAKVEGASLPTEWTSGTRGEFCQVWWTVIQQQGWEGWAFQRLSLEDADDDGIADPDDALLFTPNEPIRFEIERRVLSADRDGVPDKTSVPTQSFNFCGPGVAAGDGFVADHGQRFDRERGHGWTEDLSQNHRKRNRIDGPGDSFVFTRETATWECRVSSGRYRIRLCVGDSGHEQSSQSVSVEGDLLIDRVSTPEGEFIEVTGEVSVHDGRLTVDIGSGAEGSNTCLNWLQIEGPL